ncbi:ribonuclease hii [Lucifera butyrica]|uniref:Ribonuclease n=1 Tax=Lucifera butyrica TaxID=1351585 RepID=A0A498RCI1_9FIRM|nr:ribonuclease HIII [Lucifera butyrica]VBB06858.1 ribonuclease hii [Lucifera butyrica]
MNSLEERVAQLKQDLAAAGFRVVAERSIAYGIQFTVGKNNSKVPVNVYQGKKGISITVGGSQQDPCREEAAAIIRGDAVHDAGREKKNLPGRPPGFEQVADFDFSWIGTDESGKGDYFGPLVVAGVLVDKITAEQLLACGVKDSKALTDEKNRALADQIRTLCSGRYVELEFMPADYNRLYQQFQATGKNLNHLLAWAHARVIEDILERHSCRFALADQFAAESYLTSSLMAKGKTITLVQEHRAERNIAVAAASILARDRFLACMNLLSERFKMTFPKGASAMVREAARRFVKQNGREQLTAVSKLHFKTTEEL